jgi:hypothetical protein
VYPQHYITPLVSTVFVEYLERDMLHSSEKSTRSGSHRGPLAEEELWESESS